jgi:hypothetical protein
MSGPPTSLFGSNRFQPMVKFSTGRLGTGPIHKHLFYPYTKLTSSNTDIPPAPYNQLITDISLSIATPWTQETIDTLKAIPNLSNVIIEIHSHAYIFSSWHRASYGDCLDDVHDQNWRNNHFIDACIIQLNQEGINGIEFGIMQRILQEAKEWTGLVNNGLDQGPAADKFGAKVLWMATVDERRQLRLALDLYSEQGW